MCEREKLSKSRRAGQRSGASLQQGSKASRPASTMEGGHPSQTPGCISFEGLRRNNRHLSFISAEQSRGMDYFLSSFFFFLKVLETNDLQYWASLVVLGRYWASPVAQLVKNQPAIQETWVQSLRWEDPLEKGKATHSSILAWRIPWTV